MHKIKITQAAVERIKAGQRLIMVGDLMDQQEEAFLREGEEVMLISEANQFVAKLLVGRQHKGLGWVFGVSAKDKFNEAFIFACIEEAIRKRAAFFDDDDATNAFRLFNGEGDGIGGVTIDWYAGFIQFNWYARGVYKYQARVLESLLYLLPQIMGCYETLRFDHVDEARKIQHIYGDLAPQPLIIKEYNRHFATYLGQDLMTGIFLDQREVRQFVAQQSQDLSVLNLFSYTGAFSVAAAVGGAKQTVSVDLANRSLDRTKENFQLNQIELDSNHQIRVMDVFDYMQYAKKQGLYFDIVVCDPPSFARNKQGRFSVEQDYVGLAQDLFELTRVGGLTLISTNHSGYDKTQLIEEMVALTQNLLGTYHLIQVFGLPDDYPTTKDSMSQYLKVLVFYREA